ncbi:hypothetical protein DMI70_14465 [Escherichia coli]|nr:hypothetical protein [Escherichia coli]
MSLEGSETVSDDNGHVALNLPAADKPSRYLLTVSASDGAAYRVTTTKEILIERGFGALLFKYRHTVMAASRLCSVMPRWNLQNRFLLLMNGCVSKTARATAGATVRRQILYRQFPLNGSYNLTLRDKGSLILAGLAMQSAVRAARVAYWYGRISWQIKHCISGESREDADYLPSQLTKHY